MQSHSRFARAGGRTAARAVRRHRSALVAAALAAVIGASALPASAGAVADILPGQNGLGDLDARTGRLAPTAAQRNLATALHAAVRWNRFGTPESLIRYGGYLGPALSGTPKQAARAFIRANRDLFKLSDADVTNLEFFNDSPLLGTTGDAIVFRQRFGTLSAAQDGLITVAIKGGRVAYVSSSAAGSQPAPPAATMSPVAAWLRAAANAGFSVAAADLSATRHLNGWTVFDASGLATPLLPGAKRAIGQRARLVALPLYTGGVRPVYETIVLDQGSTGSPRAYTSFVDARTGEVLVRLNQVKQLAADPNGSGTFSGNTGDGANHCGNPHPVSVSGAFSIGVFATATVPSNDIVLELVGPGGDVVASSDEATSPEAVLYQNPGGGQIADGTYQIVVCAFQDPTVPPTSPDFDYSGAYAVNTAAGAPSTDTQAQWKFFVNAPELGTAGLPPFGYPSTDTRRLGCWIEASDPACDLGLSNLASRAPWDVNPATDLPTFTTDGNNAKTADARTSPLTPGPTGYMPPAPDRHYVFAWHNEWYSTKCDPSQLAVVGSDPLADADENAAITNLFSGHNRFHDFAYFLGFTERNYNLQQSNFGTTAPGPFPAGREGDPELGDVQAGALDGGAPTFEGRDNANQIALNDGVPGITNQYLFQPIAGAFYSPCVDGDFDTSVFGHEYTHAISNRMVGGPDAGLTGQQAGSMGESWSDLVALEYLHEHGYTPIDGEDDWAEGPYVTGNKRRGIRDYALDANPLNYSDVGFDTPGPEVHADGEIWNAVNYDVRQALVKKYDASFPSSDAALQLRCADGRPGTNAPEAPLPADQCPGNRRWIQIMFDAFLLQPADTSMLDARDAYLAADQMRFDGANQAVIWKAFAHRGFGQSASTAGTDDTDPKPGFDSPLANEATVTFSALAAEDNSPVSSTIYIGDYSARVTPVADTNPATPLPAKVKLVAGTYDVVARTPGRGLRRFTFTVGTGQTVTKKLTLALNVASASTGATATGDGANQGDLIDDNEASTWDSTGNAANVNVAKPSVTVDLAGTAPHTISAVTVSALLDPDDPDGDETRFTALRRFRVQACNSTTAVGHCTLPTDFRTIYTSPANAFPGGIPRPVAPDLIARTFDVPDTAATHVRFVVLDNQCTGFAGYHGEQDNDPTNATDCPTASTSGQDVHAAEFEVFDTRISG